MKLNKFFFYYWLTILLNVPIFYFISSKISGWVIFGLISLSLFLILFGLFIQASDTKKYFLGFYPTLPKEFFYLDKIFYIEFSRENDKYILYKKNNIFSIEEMERFSTFFSDRIFHEIKKHIDGKYQIELSIKMKSDVIKKWDGYLTTVDKRDDKIGKILS